MLAAVQAPVIMMSQNRQDIKDRLRGELDFEVDRRAASDIQGLACKLNPVDDKLDDREDRSALTAKGLVIRLEPGADYSSMVSEKAGTNGRRYCATVIKCDVRVSASEMITPP